MESVVQKFKVSSMRELVSRSLQGLPINARTRQLYDLDCDDENTDALICDDSSDLLDVMELQIQANEQLSEAREKQKIVDEQLKKEIELLKKENEQLKKGGITNETQTQNPPTQNPS